MTCTDYVNKIVVKMEREGRGIKGKLEDIPMELFAEWAKEPDGEKYVINTVMEAEEVFSRAYIEREMEKKGFDVSR